MRFYALLLLELSSVWSAPFKEVPIAVISERPRTSLDAPSYLPLLVKASRLAVKEREQEFQRLGIRIRLREYFTEGGTIVSRDRMADILAGDTVGGVGIFSSDDAVLMVPMLPKSDYLVVSPYTTSTQLLSYQPNFLQYIGSNAEMGKAMEYFMSHFIPHKRVLAIVAWDSPNSKDFFESLGHEIRKNTILIKTMEDLPDVGSVAREALSHHPDVIILPNYPVCTATLIKALTQAGFKGVFLGGDSWGEGSDPRFMRIVSGLTFSGYSFRPHSRFHLTNKEEILRAKLQERTGLKYVTPAGLYYDATNYLLDLLHELGPAVTRKSILELSKSRRLHKGVTGINCISTAECPDRHFTALKVDSLGFRLLTPNVKNYSKGAKVSRGK